MNYLDSNIFIYAINNDDSNGETCRKILTDVALDRIKAFTSCLTWDEIVHIVKKEKNREISIIEGNKFLSFPNLIILKIDKSVISFAQRLIINYSLDPRDAIHVATALSNNIHQIISDDKDFDKIKEIKRIKIGSD